MWGPCRRFWMLLLLLLSCIIAAGADNAEEDITIEDRIRSKKEAEEVEDVSHGLGNHIEWVKLEEGLIQAKDEDKPLMLIIHKSWCGACRGKCQITPIQKHLSHVLLYYSFEAID
jgi:hypothetical protein